MSVKTDYIYAKKPLKEYDPNEFSKIMKYNFRLTEQRNYIYSLDDFCLYYNVDKENIQNIIDIYTEGSFDYQTINDYISYRLLHKKNKINNNYIYSNRYMIYAFILSILTNNIKSYNNKILFKGINKKDNPPLYNKQKLKEVNNKIKSIKKEINIENIYLSILNKQKELFNNINNNEINKLKLLKNDLFKLLSFDDISIDNIIDNINNIKELYKYRKSKFIDYLNYIDEYKRIKYNKYFENKKYFQNYEIESIIKNNKLWSTSYSDKIPIMFLTPDKENKNYIFLENKNIIFKINLKKNDFGFDLIPLTTNLSKTHNEEEFLLPPNYHFQIKAIKGKIYQKNNNEYPYIEIELDIINNKEITDMKYIQCFREIVNNLHLNIELTDEQYNCINEYFNSLKSQ